MSKSTRPSPKKKKEKSQRKKTGTSSSPFFDQVNPHVAGIDIGSKPHFVAVRTEPGEVAIVELIIYEPIGGYEKKKFVFA